MKILVVQDRLRSGGTERQSVLLAQAFAAAGHNATLLTFRPGGALAATIGAGVAHRSLQPFDTGLDWFAPGLVRAVRRAAPDIVLCMGRMANCRGGALARARPEAAVIATLRTGKPLPWAFRRSLHRVRHVVANSEAARADALRRHGLPGDRITVIHNALVFPPAAGLVRSPALRTRLGADAGTVVMVCTAMFRPEKNQHELIEIAALLPDRPAWQLWFAGSGPTRAACERLAARRGLGERVRFLGFQADPSALYGAADIAVHASRSESLSNFIIEAQAHGLPAVVYDVQGMGECFLPDRTGWLVPPGDRAAFLARLQPLLAEEELRLACAPLARHFARTSFEPARQARAYLELFARLAAPSAP